MAPFNDERQNLHASFLTFLIFAKVRPVRTKVTHRQRDTHRNVQASRNRRNLADLPNKTICLLTERRNSLFMTALYWDGIMQSVPTVLAYINTHKHNTHCMSTDAWDSLHCLRRRKSTESHLPPDSLICNAAVPVRSLLLFYRGVVS